MKSYYEQKNVFSYLIVKPIHNGGSAQLILDEMIDSLPLHPCIIQNYIPNPLMYLSRKFDLRFYLLVTSVEPLQAYLYKEGNSLF